MKKLGERIKRLRRARNMTQQQLAELLGIDQGAVSRWERGHIMPSARYRQELERVLQAPLMEMDQPLLDSVNRDLHFSLVLDCELRVLAASETTLAINGCRSRSELIGSSYLPMLNETARSLYLWLQESGAFDEGINWARFTVPTPTLHSGYRWMESLWIPFRLDSGELVYRVSSRLLDAPPAEGLGRAILEVDGKQRELLIPTHGNNQPARQQPQHKDWSRAM
ncbi:helix-turn-helix domain-containing protein [Marinospirillum alkaliphilum]|uniref:Helix-turn-helix domain-containing protein n=1 Tax=Marinospirillum alkaliphilum DSM 21637 TaxID=1122209 RepID=A0A1K1U404_9GAMM|nr:helix-turn-helix transcriptional regulator [Marinospirillum alkaliphilum]SFX07574.1 Helix-turn-helix domain-containing protein [Marinospirillum alkaliphilum DSM 21637]